MTRLMELLAIVAGTTGGIRLILLWLDHELAKEH